MTIYKTLKDMKLRDSWLKANGYNPNTFFNPDLEANFIRAKAAVKNLLKYQYLLTQEQIAQLNSFPLNKNKATPRQIFQALNLNKKIRRQLHRQQG